MGKKKRRKHATEAQFARYAARHWNQLESAFALEGIRMHHNQERKPHEIAQAVLAKQLHTFAEHVCDNMRFTFVKDIPDLPEQKR